MARKTSAWGCKNTHTQKNRTHPFLFCVLSCAHIFGMWSSLVVVVGGRGWRAAGERKSAAAMVADAYHCEPRRGSGREGPRSHSKCPRGLRKVSPPKWRCTFFFVPDVRARGEWERVRDDRPTIKHSGWRIKADGQSVMRAMRVLRYFERDMERARKSGPANRQAHTSFGHCSSRAEPSNWIQITWRRD